MKCVTCNSCPGVFCARLHTQHTLKEYAADYWNIYLAWKQLDLEIWREIQKNILVTNGGVLISCLYNCQSRKAPPFYSKSYDIILYLVWYWLFWFLWHLKLRMMSAYNLGLHSNSGKLFEEAFQIKSEQTIKSRVLIYLKKKLNSLICI